MRLCINNYSLANEKTQEIRFPFRMMNEAMDYSKAHKDKKISMISLIFLILQNMEKLLNHFLKKMNSMKFICGDILCIITQQLLGQW